MQDLKHAVQMVVGLPVSAVEGLANRHRHAAQAGVVSESLLVLMQKVLMQRC